MTCVLCSILTSLIQELHETVSTLVADPTKADAFFFAQDHGLNVYRMTSADPETEAIWSSPTSTALCCLRAALPACHHQDHHKIRQ